METNQKTSRIFRLPKWVVYSLAVILCMAGAATLGIWYVLWSSPIC